MRVLVLELLWVVVLQAEAQVVLLIEPYLGRAVVFDNNPHADVEFAPADDQWVLYVLLHHVLGLLAQACVQDVVQVRNAFDAPSSRQIGWLYDPDVSIPIQLVLRLGLFEPSQHILHNFKQSFLSDCSSYRALYLFLIVRLSLQKLPLIIRTKRIPTHM